MRDWWEYCDEVGVSVEETEMRNGDRKGAGGGSLDGMSTTRFSAMAPESTVGVREQMDF